MRFLLLALAFTFALASTAAFSDGGDHYYNPYPDNGQNASDAVGRSGDNYVDQLVRREIERRRQASRPARRSSSRQNNCGKSFWTKREALNLCPPATAMKVRQDGQVFYNCDCSAD